jgi:hypothetical protein
MNFTIGITYPEYFSEANLVQQQLNKISTHRQIINVREYRKGNYK